jgi:hypothetical protein
MASPPRRSRRLALKHVSFGDFPPNVMHHILLTAATNDNLLLHVAACARVCREWWRVVGSSAAYMCMHGRANVCRQCRVPVLKALARELGRRELLHFGERLSTHQIWDLRDEGAAALGAALQAMACIRFSCLNLVGNCLTAAGVAALTAPLRRPWGTGGILHLTVRRQPGLGDDGVAVLAKALPSTLLTLDISRTGCGDDGLVALAAALPALTHLRDLDCSDNSAAARGWVTLAGALPSVPQLTTLKATNCSGIDAEGAAAALAEAISQCSWLRWVYVYMLADESALLPKPDLNEATQATLRTANRSGTSAGEGTPREGSPGSLTVQLTVKTYWQ